MVTRLRPYILSGIAASVLGACNAADEQQDESGSSGPGPEGAVASSADGMADASADTPGLTVATGKWDVNEAAESAHAIFRAEDGTQMLAMRCDVLNGTLTLTIASDESEPTAYRLDAGGEAARIDLVPASGGLNAAIEGSFKIFHAFATPGQRVRLTSASGASTQYPTHPGIQRVLNACS